jgi:3-hydroxyisobutyrate dehydrogenase-like beta-hydroxyacid dehydrogenase
MRVAFLGIGQMGGPMAANLARAGNTVRIYNRTVARAEALVDACADVDIAVGRTPADAADGADVIVTMLADPVALEAVYSGPDGALPALAPGALAIEMSTVGPQAVLRLAPRIVAAGGAIVDAPVSGSVAFAASGSLTIMVGGDDVDVARAQPILEVLGSTVIRTGRLGTGAAMKLVVNTVIYGLNQALCEALVLGERAGIDRLVAYEVIANSAVAAPFVHYRRSAFEQPESAPPAMRIDLAAKDLELILSLGDEVDASLEQAGVNLGSFRAASAAGYGDDDVVAVARHLRDQAPPVPSYVEDRS